MARVSIVLGSNLEDERGHDDPAFTVSDGQSTFASAAETHNELAGQNLREKKITSQHAGKKKPHLQPLERQSSQFFCMEQIARGHKEACVVTASKGAHCPV